ncbi:MAG: hypothetical protein HY070_02855 [Chloroflexi bacterium]|nr:hypothetical protein [Chloroflexota bacterium]
MRKILFVGLIVTILLGIVSFAAIAGISSANALPATASIQTDATVTSTTALDAMNADLPDGATISATHIGSACERDSDAGY